MEYGASLFFLGLGAELKYDDQIWAYKAYIVKIERKHGQMEDSFRGWRC